jgi:hypothetical protein
MACEHAHVVEFDSGVLESVVERALEAKQVALGEWSAEQLFADDGQGLGVFRLRGSARLGNETRAWSVILKGLREEGTPNSLAKTIKNGLVAPSQRADLFERVSPGSEPAEEISTCCEQEPVSVQFVIATMIAVDFARLTHGRFEEPTD